MAPKVINTNTGRLPTNMVSDKLHKAGVVILRSNPIAPDPRVEKVAQALAKSGYHVTVLGWDRTTSFPPQEERDFGVIYRIRLRAGFGKRVKNLPNLLGWQVSLLWWLWRHRMQFSIIHACDFDTVLPALLISCAYHKKLVYDIFDFYADTLSHVPAIIKKVTREIDLWVISKADAVILADTSRKEQIKGSQPKVLEVIYNSPGTLTNIQTRTQINKDMYTLRVAYVGILQLERGLIEMIKVIKDHSDWRLDLAGFGGDEEVILSFAAGLNNVVFHNRVSYNQALQLMAEADVLFATYDPKIPNHRYSSPNKVFEAMALGKPIIVARGMGIDKLVEKYGLGFVVEYGDVLALEKVLSTVVGWTEEQKKIFASHTQSVFSIYFSWPQMEERLIALYHGLFSSSNRR